MARHGHFNDLTPAEAERLAYLAEEMGEALQAVGKVLRHGYASHNPDNPKTGDNRVQLTKELVDVAGAITRMAEAGDVPAHVLAGADPHKGARYMHHQTSSGGKCSVHAGVSDTVCPCRDYDVP